MGAESHGSPHAAPDSGVTAGRPFRLFPAEDLLIAQALSGFVLIIGWALMYEIYHEDGSYYTSLLQEILATEGLFPSFLLLAILMAFPVGLIVDSVREVVGEGWLGLPRTRPDGRHPAAALPGLPTTGPASPDFWARYAVYRHAWAAVLAPARAAGNLALVLLLLATWFVVKMITIQGWDLFPPAFLVGAPLTALALAGILLTRYLRGARSFSVFAHDSLFSPTACGPNGSPEPIGSSEPGPAADAPASPLDTDRGQP